MLENFLIQFDQISQSKTDAMEIINLLTERVFIMYHLAGHDKEADLKNNTENLRDYLD